MLEGTAEDFLQRCVDETRCVAGDGDAAIEQRLRTSERQTAIVTGLAVSDTAIS